MSTEVPSGLSYCKGNGGQGRPAPLLLFLFPDPTCHSVGGVKLGSQGSGFNLTSPLTRSKTFVSLLASIYLPPNASKYIFSLTLTTKTKQS